MNNLREGVRLFVKTNMFEGLGTLMFILKNEIFPYQIELDDPDEDGHKIKRVARHEILEIKEDIDFDI